MNTQSKRLENETFEEYKIRRKKLKKDLKFYLQGEIIWDSKLEGTYEKKIHKYKKDTTESNH
tara:strand:+ start:325 stop:510 length:186 start_codon:yes stop_codon:yes gene_type:complete